MNVNMEYSGVLWRLRDIFIDTKFYPTSLLLGKCVMPAVVVLLCQSVNATDVKKH